MKLFPASVSPLALERLAYDAWRTGPTAAEQRAEDDAERRHTRALDMCAESFDTVDFAAMDWLADDAQSGDVSNIYIAAIRGNEDDLRSAINRLRDRYLDQRADKYHAKVLDEEQRDREDAEYSDWEWRHG